MSKNLSPEWDQYIPFLNAIESPTDFVFQQLSAEHRGRELEIKNGYKLSPEDQRIHFVYEVLFNKYMKTKRDLELEKKANAKDQNEDTQ